MQAKFIRQTKSFGLMLMLCLPITSVSDINAVPLADSNASVPAAEEHYLYYQQMMCDQHVSTASLIDHAISER